MNHCTITIANNGLSFEVPRGEIILDSALAQKIALPHQCRGASCGTCKAEVLEGAVDHGWSLGFALSDEEKESGYCLMCQASPASETLSLRTVNPMPEDEETAHVSSFKATVVGLSHETPRVCHVRLQVPQGMAFSYPAGTYAELHIEGISPHRVYSFANPCSSSRLVEFYVALQPEGKTSGHIHKRMRLGDRVGIKGPYGACSLPTGEGPVLCAVGGTGLAPVLAILTQALSEGLKDPVHLLFSVREDAEVFAWDRLHALSSLYGNFSFDLVTDVPGRLAPYGLPVAALLPRLFPDLSRHRLIFSGAPGFVDMCLASASNQGAKKERISFDRFAPAAQVPDEKGGTYNQP